MQVEHWYACCVRTSDSLHTECFTDLMFSQSFYRSEPVFFVFIFSIKRRSYPPQLCRQVWPSGPTQPSSLSKPFLKNQSGSRGGRNNFAFRFSRARYHMQQWGVFTGSDAETAGSVCAAVHQTIPIKSTHESLFTSQPDQKKNSEHKCNEIRDLRTGWFPKIHVGLSQTPKHAGS